MLRINFSIERLLGFDTSGNAGVFPLCARKYKGKSIIDFPKNFCVVDLETTGLSVNYDSIIEIGALKYSNGSLVDKFQSLVRNNNLSIPDYITELTGITNEMLDKASISEEVISSFDKFLCDSVIVGYNVNFDVNFLYDYYLTYLNKPLTNDFVDLLRVARKLYPDLSSHRLSDMINLLGLSKRRLHRALDDCEVTALCYEKFKETVLSKYQSINEFQAMFYKGKIKANEIHGDVSKHNSDSPLYKKHCVFTGKLERFTRKEAMQLVADLGGINQDNVTKETNFLILGNNDYCSSIVGGKSLKHNKAEKYKLEGRDIEILSEAVFYDMIANEIFQMYDINSGLISEDIIKQS